MERLPKISAEERHLLGAIADRIIRNCQPIEGFEGCTVDFGTTEDLIFAFKKEDFAVLARVANKLNK